MARFFARFARNESGSTAVEYGLIAVILCIGIAASLPALRDVLVTAYSTTTAMLSGAS